MYKEFIFWHFIWNLVSKFIVIIMTIINVGFSDCNEGDISVGIDWLKQFFVSNTLLWNILHPLLEHYELNMDLYVAGCFVTVLHSMVWLLSSSWASSPHSGKIFPKHEWCHYCKVQFVIVCLLVSKGYVTFRLLARGFYRLIDGEGRT